jgi:hypothetical protein
MTSLELLRKVRTSEIADALDSMGLPQGYEMDAARHQL